MPAPSNSLLVPFDLSDEAERAIGPALDLASRTGASVTFFIWSYDEGEAADAKSYLQELASGLDAAVPVRVQAAVTEDETAAPPIVAAAARQQATICMTTHGRSGLGHALLGSVAEEVLRIVDGPVILVGPHVGSGEPVTDPVVLICVDGTPRSEQVLPPAVAWAEALGLLAQAVQVIEPSTPYPDYDPSDVLETAYLSTLTAGTGVSDYEVLHGDAAAAIVVQAKGRAGLVAVGTKARKGLARAVLGSVAMKVVHGVECPVLAVRTEADDGT